MNKRKGFFRLTIVLSIVVGIIVPFHMEGNFRHKMCEAEEKVYESLDPPMYPPSGFKTPIGPPIEPPKVTFTYGTPSNGIVRSTRRVMFKCIGGGFSLLHLTKPEELNKIFEGNLGKIAVEKGRTYITYSYRILGEKDVFEWKGVLGMGIMSFIVVWFIYAFIKWVIIAFIVGGFKHKP